MAILQATAELLEGSQVEIAIFITAVFAHALLFGKYRIKPAPIKAKRGRSSEDEQLHGGQDASRAQPRVSPLARVVRPLVQEGADRAALAQQLASQLKTCPAVDAPEALARMLESFGKGPNVELLAAVRAVLRELGLQLSARLGELLLQSYLRLRLRREFDDVLGELGVDASTTPGIMVLTLRSAISSSDLDSAVGHLQSFAPHLRAVIPGAESASLQQLMQQLARLALEKAALPTLLHELHACGLFTAPTSEAILVECARQGQASVLQEAERFARAHGVELTALAHCALLRESGSAQDAQRLFAEAVERELVTADVLLAAACAASAHCDVALATAAVRQLPSSPAPRVAVAYVHLCAEGGPLAGEDAHASALGLYERHFAGVDLCADARAGRIVAEAALRKGRPDVLGRLMSTPQGSARQIALLKEFGAAGRLDDAAAVFRACPEKTAYHYNALLDMCVECRDMEAAERVMSEAKSANADDTVTYNTVIKAHLCSGNVKRARAAIAAMRAAGFSPNSVTFNELIDATIKTKRSDAWDLVEEMKACELQPNTITCSILLKGLQSSSKVADVERTMELVTSMGKDMDEVLLSSVCEACIRIGRTDMLSRQLKRFRAEGAAGVQIKGAHTYGSIIRAYGVLKDVGGVWEMWREMRSQHIIPTSITIGCMVEALVGNGDPDAGYKLIQELRGDKQTKPMLNAVIYCSVLKGFSHQKRFHRVWAAHEEMRAERLPLSITTYNALIDACARSYDMARIPSLLQDMEHQEIKPNIITYSTILKAYCQENRLEKAFEVLEDMKRNEHLRPDEITYNTLLDGCARHGLYDRGIAVLEDMQEAGVFPSSFTLSVLVKLANRAKRPEKAFELCEALSQKYHIRLNVYVYNNLVHACTAHGDARRALEVFEKMVRERVRPDVRTYTLLLRGCIGAGEAQDAAGLLRAAMGLPGTHPRFSQLGTAALQAKERLSSELITEVLGDIAVRCGERHLATQLFRDVRNLPGVTLDPKTQLQWASHAANTLKQA